MRISDWSSDVCSSDLWGARNWAFLMLITAPVLAIATTRSVWRDRKAGSWMMSQTSATTAAWADTWTSVMIGTPKACLMSWKMRMRSEGRREGKECCSKCRTWRYAYDYKTKNER